MGRPLQIIAEIGVNHNGDLRLAKKLIREARRAGADIAKFQYYRTENLVSPQAPLADYQRRKGARTLKNQYELLKRLELSLDQMKELARYARGKVGIEFLVSVFGVREFEEACRHLSLNRIKIPSGELVNIPLLKAVSASSFLECYLSTGMADLDEIQKAVRLFPARSNLTLFYCVSLYPTPLEEVALGTIRYFQDRFRRPVGFSDHTVDDFCPLLALPLGITVLEKHFTLDHRLPGPDHPASMDPRQFTDMVRRLRAAEGVLNRVKRRVTRAERTMRYFARKSLYAVRDLRQGETLTEEAVQALRPQIPGTLSLNQWDQIIRRCVLRRGVPALTPLRPQWLGKTVEKSNR